MGCGTDSAGDGMKGDRGPIVPDLCKDTTSVVIGFLSGYRPVLRLLGKGRNLPRDDEGTAISPRTESRDLCDLLVEGDHSAALNWACRSGLVSRTIVGVMAARYGRISMLEWSKSDWIPFRRDVYCEAVEYDRMPVVEWLHDRRLLDDLDVCATAALFGRLGILRWARGEDYPWDSTTCDCAATFGHVDVLRWAINNGCPCGIRASINAAQDEQIGCLDLMLEKGVLVLYLVWLTARSFERKGTMMWLKGMPEQLDRSRRRDGSLFVISHPESS